MRSHSLPLHPAWDTRLPSAQLLHAVDAPRSAATSVTTSTVTVPRCWASARPYVTSQCHIPLLWMIASLLLCLTYK